MNPTVPFWLTLGERMVAFLMLILFWPILVFFAFLIRITSDGPILIRDTVASSCGRSSQYFRFRATGEGTATFHVFGKFLRRYSLDELPGFLSVICGEVRLRE